MAPASGSLPSRSTPASGLAQQPRKALLPFDTHSCLSCPSLCPENPSAFFLPGPCLGPVTGSFLAAPGPSGLQQVRLLWELSHRHRLFLVHGIHGVDGAARFVGIRMVLTEATWMLLFYLHGWLGRWILRAHSTDEEVEALGGLVTLSRSHRKSGAEMRLRRPSLNPIAVLKVRTSLTFACYIVRGQCLTRA